MQSLLIFLFSFTLFFLKIETTFKRTTQAIIHSNDSPFLSVSPFYFNFGAAIVPKPNPDDKLGQDSLLASKYILAVADGVGSWVNFGINPSNYSYHLMHNADLYFHSYPQTYSKNPAKLLYLSAVTNSYKGTSTMIVCTLSGDDMFTANVGDSGYMVLIPVLKDLPNNMGTTFIYDIAFKSEPQQHGYNFPFQLGPTGDDPLKVIQPRVHRVGYGALVLTYSDGVSDNLFPHEIKVIVNLYIQELKMKSGIQIRDFVPVFDPNELARRIKEKAFQKSSNVEAITPFQVDALNWGVIFPGGKVDDISIVVGMVLDSPKEAVNEEKKDSNPSSKEDKKVEENEVKKSPVDESDIPKENVDDLQSSSIENDNDN